MPFQVCQNEDFCSIVKVSSSHRDLAGFLSHLISRRRISDGYPGCSFNSNFASFFKRCSPVLSEFWPLGFAKQLRKVDYVPKLWKFQEKFENPSI